MKDLSRNLGNILSVGTWKASLTSGLSPWCGSNRSGVAWGSLTNRHLPLCLDLKEVVGKGDQGNLISLCLFPQPFSELAFLGNWAGLAWRVREARGTSWVGRSRGLPRDARAGAERGRDHRPPRPHRPSHLHWIWYFTWDFNNYFLVDSQTPVPLPAPKQATFGRPFW